MSMCSNCSVFNSSWGAKKGVTSKRDAYDIKDSSRRLVVPRSPNLQLLVQTPEPPGKIPKPMDSGSNQS
jgi:hypothetical protein